MQNAALLTIDMQKDFCAGGTLVVPEGETIVPLINSLQDKFALRVFTQDWHPADHSSFADNHKGAEVFSQIDMPYGPQTLWPRHAVLGTEGSDFVDGLDAHKAHMIIRKGFRTHIDSYSAFFENDGTTQTGLEAYLRAHNIDKVFICGLATDYCAGYSALDAAKLGFDVTIIMDACRGIDMGGTVSAITEKFKAAGVKIVNSDDL